MIWAMNLQTEKSFPKLIYRQFYDINKMDIHKDFVSRVSSSDKYIDNYINAANDFKDLLNCKLDGFSIKDISYIKLLW
jgi:hypothetical protein